MFPALFVSHGAPTLPFDDGPARDFLRGLGHSLPRPKAILAVSAHWETAQPTLTASTATLHDFRGFPKSLYDLSYDAPGDPALAAKIASQLEVAGFAASLDDRRGRDHGAWVPLLLMYPEAAIPVVQLSIQPRLGPSHHMAVGRALASWRDEVLILASGGFVHNLRTLDWNGGAEPEWSARFSEWMDRVVRERRDDDLMNYRARAPEAARAHPSEDHILPLFVAYGAGTSTRRLHTSASFGSLRLDAYAFD